MQNLFLLYKPWLDYALLMRHFAPYSEPCTSTNILSVFEIYSTMVMMCTWDTYPPLLALSLCFYCFFLCLIRIFYWPVLAHNSVGGKHHHQAGTSATDEALCSSHSEPFTPPIIRILNMFNYAVIFNNI